jgi:hypothetical protein
MHLDVNRKLDDLGLAQLYPMPIFLDHTIHQARKKWIKSKPCSLKWKAIASDKLIFEIMILTFTNTKKGTATTPKYSEISGHSSASTCHG